VGGACGTHLRGDKRVQGFGEKAEGKNHLKDRGVDGIMGLEWFLGIFGGRGWSGFTWFRIGTDGVLS
jgi:hypothetical protein